MKELWKKNYRLLLKYYVKDFLKNLSIFLFIVEILDLTKSLIIVIVSNYLKIGLLRKDLKRIAILIGIFLLKKRKKKIMVLLEIVRIKFT
jgi:hypothetical protein